MYVKSEKFNFKKHFYNLGDIMGKKLLDIMRDKIRVKHYSLKTENVYIYWAKKYILFHNKRHPNTMGKKEIEDINEVLLSSKYYPAYGEYGIDNFLNHYAETVKNILLKKKLEQDLQTNNNKILRRKI